MEKQSIAFVFFGQNRTEKFIKKQLIEIDKATTFFKYKFEFFIIDATLNKIQSAKLDRLKLIKSKNINIEKEIDPLAKFRSDGGRKLSKGMNRATMFLQVLDFLE